jgi:hypothetical protein
MKQIITTIMVVLAIIASSCDNKTNSIEGQSSSSDTIGKYVYLSSCHILHTRRDCSELYKEKDQAGHCPAGISFIDTSRICINPDYLWYCKKCFNNKQFEFIDGINERNYNEEHQEN